MKAQVTDGQLALLVLGVFVLGWCYGYLTRDGGKLSEHPYARVARKVVNFVRRRVSR